jgi:hypothetical protein
MALSEILANAAKAEFDRKRQIEADAKALADKAQRKKLWEAFNGACEFVPNGPADHAARTWAGLFMAACDQLKAAGEVGRLETMRYKGADPLRMAGMEAAFRVCRLACAGDHAEVKNSVRTLIESPAGLDSPFRLFLECVRDNRQWWTTAESLGR